MSLATVHSRALDGLAAAPVTVEVHLANGLPSFTVVGLADTEVKEARERVRAALANSGLGFPANKRITVNLAPADLPKEGGRFDLPMALGLLAANGQIDMARLARFECAGELSLAGELRPVRGALAMALALRQAGTGRELLLPEDSAAEAALVDGLVVRQARHLLDVVAALQPEGEALPGAAALPRDAAHGLPDLADIKGQAAPKRALEIAAAGGHSLLMVGPPGTGKSMLAQRLPGLLPPLDDEAALESAAVLSLAGQFDIARWGQRPVRSPHHSASSVALVGGGSPPRPGEISLAQHGVLFLDELPLRRGYSCLSLSPSDYSAITKAHIARRASSQPYTVGRRLSGGAMAKVLLMGCRCERCMHEWVPREKDKDPTVCPSCKSPYWDKPRRGAAAAQVPPPTAASSQPRTIRAEARGRAK
ncbi:ATP-binding protein [Roseateles asaccharophilus]|nr:ATP-binding protein [Roseateles asaccharophilus]